MEANDARSLLFSRYKDRLDRYIRTSAGVGASYINVLSADDNIEQDSNNPDKVMWVYDSEMYEALSRGLDSEYAKLGFEINKHTFSSYDEIDYITISWE